MAAVVNVHNNIVMVALLIISARSEPKIHDMHAPICGRRYRPGEPKRDNLKSAVTPGVI